jgi:uncharacterized protein (TIGR02145 family)
MRTKIHFRILILFLSVVIMITGCEKYTPTISTTAVSQVTDHTAVSGGDITDNGGAVVSARGLVWSTIQNPSLETNQGITTAGEGSGVFSSKMYGLIINTKYYVRAYATNEEGTAYGEELSFSTVGPPIVTTIDASTITNCKATLNGIINANNSSAAVKFEYGITSGYGSFIEYTQNPVDGTTDTDVSIEISGLISGQTYYFRVVATNSYGRTNGDGLTFKTTVKDADGNSYNTIIIGTQIWISENLKTTKYNDSTSIPSVTNFTDWSNSTTPAYCWYNNDQATYGNTYGALYNLYVVNTGKLCPSGWHIPTDGEWNTLTTYLGGYSVAGGILKETGTAHWSSPNTGATNESGFTALPGGYRYSNGTFYVIGSSGLWWSATSNIAREVNSGSGEIVTAVGYNYKCGLSVRCMRD